MAAVEREVPSWFGVGKAMGRSGHVDVTAYRVDRRQIGHTHHNGVVNPLVPKAVRNELIAVGRAGSYPAGFATAVSIPLRTTATLPGVV